MEARRTVLEACPCRGRYAELEQWGVQADEENVTGRDVTPSLHALSDDGHESADAPSGRGGHESENDHACPYGGALVGGPYPSRVDARGGLRRLSRVAGESCGHHPRHQSAGGDGGSVTKSDRDRAGCRDHRRHRLGDRCGDPGRAPAHVNVHGLLPYRSPSSPHHPRHDRGQNATVPCPVPSLFLLLILSARRRIVYSHPPCRLPCAAKRRGCSRGSPAPNAPAEQPVPVAGEGRYCGRRLGG